MSSPLHHGTRWRARVATIVATAAALLTLACGSGETTAPGAPLPGIGTFTLQQVDDQAIPAPTFDDWVEGENGQQVRLRVEASEGTLLVEPDGRYQLRVLLSVYQNGVRIYRSTYADHGRWHAPAGGTTRVFDSEYIENVHFTGIAGPHGVVIDHNVVGEGWTSRFAFGAPR